VSAANETAPGRVTAAGRCRGLAPCFAWRQSAANHHGPVRGFTAHQPVPSVVVLRRASRHGPKTLTARADFSSWAVRAAT